MNMRTLGISLTSVAACLLAACGGGSSAPPQPDPPAPPPPAVSQKGIEGVGIVAGFGNTFNSIKVGARTYDATSAQVTIDDQPAMLSDLDLGDIVAVMATTSDDGATASATAIRQINDLEGTVDAGSIDLNAGTFRVLGQTIRVVATTLFDDNLSPASLEGLSDGLAVEVSVLEAADGSYTATRVEADDDAGDFELTGVVSNLDAAAFQFNIGPLRVDYAQATLEGFAGGEVMDGDRVEVAGSALGAGGELIADEVSNENDDFDGDDGDFGEIEGFVTRFVSITDFDVDQVPVTTTAQTAYEDGVAADLALGVRVEVYGVFDGSGTLVADDIDFEDGEDEAEVEVAAVVDAVDAGAGTVTALGLTVNVEPDSILEDNSDADLAPFELADLNVGDYVELTLLPTDAGLEVIVLERDDLDDDSRLGGTVEAVAEPQLTVVGVTVETTAATQFEDLDDSPLSAAAFFDAVAVGDRVEVQGVWNGTALVADEVALSDD